MNLQEKNKENMAYMIEKIAGKLQIVNASLIKAEDFPIERYNELLELYELIEKQSHFSISELEAIAAEIGNLRKKE